MPHSLPQPIYDPAKTYQDNFDHGPFGGFNNPMSFNNPGRPYYRFLNEHLYSPFGIPAGPLLNAKYVTSALMKGFDVVTYKTQRSVPFEVNPFPNVLYVDVDGDLTLEKAAQPLVGRTTTDRPYEQLTITNSFAMPSQGPAFWAADLKKSLSAPKRGQMIIMSVVGTIQPGFTAEDYYDDFAKVTRLAALTGVQAIEVNLSCPNVATEGVLCYSPKAVGEIMRRCKKAAGPTPLIAKIGYYSRGQQRVLERVVTEMSPYVNAICAINTIAAPVVTDAGEQALPGEGRLKSGMCGAGIKWAGLDMVRRLVRLRTKLKARYEIVGVGGVMTPADVHEYLDAGANLVQSATGAMWNPDLAIELKDTLHPTVIPKD